MKAREKEKIKYIGDSWDLFGRIFDVYKRYENSVSCVEEGTTGPDYRISDDDYEVLSEPSN